MNPDKAYIREMGTDHYIDECVERIQDEFKLSDNQVAKALRKKAQELAPRKTREKVIKIPKEVFDKVLQKHLSLLSDSDKKVKKND